MFISVYGRLSVLTGKMSQGLQDTTRARTQIYTDDCVTLRGTPSKYGEDPLLPSAWDVIHGTVAMQAKVFPSAGEIIE